MEPTMPISLERRLHEAKKLSLPEDVRESIKAFLFTQMSEKNEMWFQQMVRGIEATEDISHARDRVWEKLESHLFLPGTAAGASMRFMRKAWFWKLIGGILFGCGAVFFSFYILLGTNEESVVSSEIISASGEVYSAEDIHLIPLQAGTILDPGMTLESREGTLEMRFFENSFLRLAPNTKVFIEKLTPHPSLSEAGEIQISLEEGNIWVHTFYDPSSDLHFIVRSGGTVITPFTGALSVEKKGNETKIFIWEKSARISNPGKEQSAMFIAGTKIQFSLLKGREIDSITNNDKNSPWIQESMEQDTAFREEEFLRLVDAYARETGVTPDSFFYPAKIALEKVVQFGDSPEEKIFQIKKRMKEIILLFASSHPEEGKELMDIIESRLREFNTNTPDFVPLVESMFDRFQRELSSASVEALPREALKSIETLEERIFPDAPFYSHRNALEYLWRIQRSVFVGETLISKDGFDAYREIKASLPPPITDDPGEKREIIRLKIQEVKLLNYLFFQLFADSEILESEDRVIREILMTTEGKESIDHLLWNNDNYPRKENPIDLFEEKIDIYKTIQGKKNQAVQLLAEVEVSPLSLPFLQELRKRTDEELRDVVTDKMILILEEEMKKIIIEANE